MNIEEKSKIMYDKRKKYLEEQLNPHEKEMSDFVKEVIKEYNITNLEEWRKYCELIPDCASKTIMDFHYQGYEKKR